MLTNRNKLDRKIKLNSINTRYMGRIEILENIHMKNKVKVARAAYHLLPKA
jgi:hypothetical protein